MNLPRPVGSARNWQLGSGELRESSGSDGRWGLAHSQSASRASECCFEILIPLLTVGHQKDLWDAENPQKLSALPKASGRNLILRADLILNLSNLAQLRRHFPKKQRVLWPHNHLHAGQHLRHLFTERFQ
jgi:hypothetical protein